MQPICQLNLLSYKEKCLNYRQYLSSIKYCAKVTLIFSYTHQNDGCFHKYSICGILKPIPRTFPFNQPKPKEGLMNKVYNINTGKVRKKQYVYKAKIIILKHQLQFLIMTIYILLLPNYTIFQLIMERSREKKTKATQSPIFQSQSSSHEHNQQKPHIFKRRIRKGPKKLNRKTSNTIHNQQSSLLSHFLDSHSYLFTTYKQQSLNTIVKSLKSEVHVRQILSIQGNAFPNLTIERCSEQARNYFELLKDKTTSKLEGLGLQSNGMKISVNCLKTQRHPKDKQPNSLCFLSSSETFLRLQRQKTMLSIKSYVQKISQEMGYPITDIPYFESQLLTLCKMTKRVEHQVLDRLSWTLVSEDPLFGCHQTPSLHIQIELKNQYITLLVLKNIQQAFNEQPIDFYNYHLSIEHREDHMELGLPFHPITTLSSFRKYILARKPKSHKSANYLLRTPCSACLSDFSQLANPIENCPQCSIRIHRYCQRVESRCHRCRYGRTSNAEKSQTNFCYICSRPREKGLMIQTVTNCAPHQYAHVFCLFLSNLWLIEKEEIKGEYLPHEPGQWQCKFCGVQDGLYSSCSKCGTLFHGMCAYLEGCSFQLQRGHPQSEKNYSIRIDCCREKERRRRLSMQRRFKINLQKLIFREDEQLFNYIEQRMRGCP